MILKRVEKEGIVKAIYESSNILASKYDKANESLTVTFKNGGNYTYANVPLTEYTRFEIAESQGKVMNSRIKKYDFTNNGKVDITKIIAEVNNIRDERIKELEADMIKIMDKTIKGYAKNNEMDNALLQRLQYLISTRQIEINE